MQHKKHDSNNETHVQNHCSKMPQLFTEVEIKEALALFNLDWEGSVRPAYEKACYEKYKDDEVKLAKKFDPEKVGKGLTLTQSATQNRRSILYHAQFYNYKKPGFGLACAYAIRTIPDPDLKRGSEPYRMTFGRYVGKTPEEIFVQDPNYLPWILPNKLTPDACREACAKLPLGKPTKKRIEELKKQEQLSDKVVEEMDTDEGPAKKRSRDEAEGETSAEDSAFITAMDEPLDLPKLE